RTSRAKATRAEPVDCPACPLRSNAAFRPCARAELDLIRSARRGQIELEARQEIVVPNEGAEQFYTLFRGWAYQYRTLANGARQVTAILMPGDSIGMFGALNGPPHHGVRSLTAVTL